MSLLPIFGALSVVAAIPLLWWSVSGARTSSAAARNLTAGRAPVTDLRRSLLERSAAERATGPAIDRLAQRARRMTPDAMLENLERRILLAGVPGAWPMERVLAAKLLLGGVAAAVCTVWFLGGPGAARLAVGAAVVAFGWFLPDLLLFNAAEHRQIAIRQALPDTIDQMTISVEAGLAFDAAMARAGRSGTGPLNVELQRTMQDVSVGMSRSDALKALVERTQVDDLRHFVLAVQQADTYGVPIARVLRIQASEMRVKRRQNAEERAMKLPVKILFPLLTCILPTMFLVLLGPAVIRIWDTLGNR
jgi:tight adherence protein C